MAIKYLILDLDNTLYSKQVGLIEHIDQRIDDFLMQRLALEHEAVNRLRHEYYKKYGTTLRGIKENHGIDPLEYFEHAYHVDLDKFLSPDPQLRQILWSIPALKIVFSNSPMPYVQNVLKALSIDDLIEHVFDLTFSECRGKPDPETYHLVLKALSAKGEDCMMVEDYSINLIPAKELAMTTVLIDDNPVSEKPPFVDFLINSIYQLNNLFRDISR